MIRHQKLNNYVKRLQTCETSEYDSLFSEFYRELKSAWASEGAIESLAYQYRLDKDDVLSIANQKSFEIIEKYSESKGNFYYFLSSSVSRKLVDEAKKRNERANAQASSFETSMEDDPAFIPYIPHANAEGEAVEFLQKESEQNKLPTSLLESEQSRLLTLLLEKADDKCRQAAVAFSKSKSYRAVAKQLGISHHAAKRRVEKVAKQFNSDTYGAIYDYFTVPTTTMHSA